MRSPLAWFSVIFCAALRFLIPEVAFAERAVVVKNASVVLDGEVVGSAQIGQIVVVLGTDEKKGMTLISVPNSEGRPLVGLVPSFAVLRTTDEPSESADFASGAAWLPPKESHSVPRQIPPPAAELAQFAEEKAWRAEELSEFVKDHRHTVSEYLGKRVRVAGVVTEARTNGQHAGLQFYLMFRTPPGCPKVRVNFSRNYLFSKKFRDQFQIGQEVAYDLTPRVSFRNTGQGVAARAVWERKLRTSSHDATSTKEVTSEIASVWVPVVSLNSVTKIVGYLTDVRFEVVLTDAEFAD